MMDSFTRSCKNATLDGFWRLLWACALALTALTAYADSGVEITQLRLERSDDEVQLSAQLHFELPTVVEDALLKGIPMVFVMGADTCLLYTSPSPRDYAASRMPSSA